MFTQPLVRSWIEPGLQHWQAKDVLLHCLVLSVFSLFTWISLGSLAIHRVPIEDLGQTAWILRLIRGSDKLTFKLCNLFHCPSIFISSSNYAAYFIVLPFFISSSNFVAYFMVLTWFCSFQCFKIWPDCLNFKHWPILSSASGALLIFTLKSTLNYTRVLQPSAKKKKSKQ